MASAVAIAAPAKTALVYQMEVRNETAVGCAMATIQLAEFAKPMTVQLQFWMSVASVAEMDQVVVTALECLMAAQKLTFVANAEEIIPAALIAQELLTDLLKLTHVVYVEVMVQAALTNVHLPISAVRRNRSSKRQKNCSIQYRNIATRKVTVALKGQ